MSLHVELRKITDKPKEGEIDSYLNAIHASRELQLYATHLRSSKN